MSTRLSGSAGEGFTLFPPDWLSCAPGYPPLDAATVPCDNLLITDAARTLPLWLLTEAQLPGWLSEHTGAAADWVRGHGFQAERYRMLAYPGSDGSLGGAVVGLGALEAVDDLNLWHAAGLSERLPPQIYQLANTLAPGPATQFVLGWLVGAYRHGRYRSKAAPASRATLVPPRGSSICDGAIRPRAASHWWARASASIPAASI
ncbi:MAG TPA: hypothetical protein VGL55_11440 [Steroidobacteraceae bacterium]